MDLLEGSPRKTHSSGRLVFLETALRFSRFAARGAGPRLAQTSRTPDHRPHHPGLLHTNDNHETTDSDRTRRAGRHHHAEQPGQAQCHGPVHVAGPDRSHPGPVGRRHAALRVAARRR
ncbi:hypothetical protein CBM2637_A170119 [Cupriavidus taiwanensis]|nr:hypothetical protein CBM2637_A170119 [Cupriavidus taiwanensis]